MPLKSGNAKLESINKLIRSGLLKFALNDSNKALIKDLNSYEFNRGGKMETNTVQDLIETRTHLLNAKKQLCDDATLEVVQELKKVDTDLKDMALKATEKNAETFEMMAVQVGEMFRMAFKLYTLKGVDLGLKLTNHVQWIELNYPKWDTHQYCQYDKGPSGELIPDTNNLNFSFEKVKTIYNENFPVL